MLEACVYQLAEILSDHRSATIENVQRRQARTLAEREAEDEDSDAENDLITASNGNAANTDANGDAEEDDIPYNPKNLPLGWDGKVSAVFATSLFHEILRLFDQS